MDEMLIQTPEEKEVLQKLEEDLATQEEHFKSMLSGPLAQAYVELAFLQRKVVAAKRTESFMDGIRFGAKMAAVAASEPSAALN